MKIEEVPNGSVMNLLAAARYAVEHSGDHGCSWCKSWGVCPQCEAYFRLTAALKPFEGAETPPHPAPSSTLDFY